MHFIKIKRVILILCFLILTSNMSLFAQLFKNSKDTSVAVRIPIGVSWWTVADDEWKQSVSGIAGLRTGVELFPVKNGLTPEDGSFRLYLRTLVNWKIGTGNKNTYGTLFNEFGIQAGVFAKINITNQHGIYAGAGPLFALESYSFKPKYGSKKTVTRRGTAFFLNGGYNFHLKNKMALFMEIEYDGFITEGLINSFVPSLGMSFDL